MTNPIKTVSLPWIDLLVGPVDRGWKNTLANNNRSQKTSRQMRRELMRVIKKEAKR